MKTNTTRSLKWLTGAVIALGLMALALFTVQSFGFFTGTPQKAVWIEGFKGMQVSIIILRLIGSITCFSLILAFLFNSIKGQKNGELFLRKNIGILFGLAAASFITLLCSGNMHIVMGERHINIGFTELFVPIIICIVALIYRNAVQVSEENSLTI
ncbi:MAG: hypothetical protein E7113_05530 [Bacteroidales bacterium]|nr:hypothetical protein [Bacteroidales bacterium]